MAILSHRHRTQLRGASLPWSAGFVIAVLIYGLFRLALFGSPAGTSLMPTLVNLLRGGVMVISLSLAYSALSVSSTPQSQKNRSSQAELQAIRSLSGTEFRARCADAFQAQGYEVDTASGKGIMPTPNLTLARANQTSLVFCGRWRSTNVGIKEIRDLYAALASRNADRGIFVTTGSFTPAAIEYAMGKPIQLIDGRALLQMFAEDAHADAQFLRADSNIKGKSECAAPNSEIDES